LEYTEGSRCQCWELVLGIVATQLVIWFLDQTFVTSACFHLFARLLFHVGIFFP